MSEHHREEVGRILAEHARLIDELHHKLAAVGEPDKAKLTAAIEHYKKAHKALHDDCLECWQQ
jgi:hypothetical protein